jgi:uncharacterized protein DUF3515
VTEDDRDGPPRGALIAALAVAATAVVALLVVAALRQTPPKPAPVAIAAAPAPQADADSCRALLAALPDALGDYHRAEAVEPVPAGAAAWQDDRSGDPVILRCGLARPDDFVASSPLQAVDDVDWFRIGDQGRTTWVAVDRPVYVALTLPDGSGPTPIQLISGAVAKAMPAVKPDPGPVR